MITEKINSIFDINECLFFKELGVAGHEYITSNNYYEWYYSLTKEINPESILETQPVEPFFTPRLQIS